MSKSLQNILTKEMLQYEYNCCKSMQKIANKFNISVDSVYKYMKLHNVKYEKHFKGIYTCNEKFFNSCLPESFYVAGFIAADGSLYNGKYSKTLKICLSNKDSDHLEKIKKALNSNNPIKEYNVKPSKLVKTLNKCVELSITNKTIFNDLEKFNIVPNKTFIYEMPEWLIEHPLINHFMRGYFDGDGTITYCGLAKNRTIKQINFSVLGTKKFTWQYRELLIKNCKLNLAKITKHYSVYKISYSGNNIVKNIYDFLYKDASIFLDRKQEKFML